MAAAKTDTQRIAELEKQVQALVEDFCEQVYDHDGKVEWDDEQGWLMIVEPFTGEPVSRKA